MPAYNAGMEQTQLSRAQKIYRIAKWAFVILIAVYVLLVFARVVHFVNADKTEAEVAKIHATKLTMADVMGEDLPPDPGERADDTIAGIDANENGIRDDVELAVFAAYPDSAKTRAVLLQYALVLQLEPRLTIVNERTATAVAEKESQAYDCIGSIVPVSDDDIEQIEKYRNFIEDYQLNTLVRKNLKEDFDEKTRSFELQSGCDVNLERLSN